MHRYVGWMLLLAGCGAAPVASAPEPAPDAGFLEQYAATYRFRNGTPTSIAVAPDAVFYLQSGPRDTARALFVFEPAILLSGDPSDIAIAVVRLVLGVWLVSGCLVGQLLRPLPPVVRAVFFVAGIAAICPDVALPMPDVTVPATLAAALACVLFDFAGARMRKAL